MARSLKFWIYIVEGLYYPCGENKGADQLRGYRKADLRLCFRICKKPVFSQRGSNKELFSDRIAGSTCCLMVLILYHNLQDFYLVAMAEYGCYRGFNFTKHG